MSDNLSVVLHKKDDLRLEVTESPPSPGPYEVQLESNTVGLCGSDIHLWKDGGIDRWLVKEPVVLGHEPSGVVVKVGADVNHLKVGDRVAVEPGIPCLRCQVCKEGNYNLCPELLFFGVAPLGGALRRHYNMSATFCHKLPDNITLAEGALMEPLSVGVYACKRANIVRGCGKKVMVTGAGPIGLVTALTAKALGAEDVCILDINQNRLNFAKKLGITKTVLIDPKSDVKCVAQEVLELLEDNPMVTMECTGAEMCLNLGIEATKDGGCVVMVGFNRNSVNVRLSGAACRQVDLLGLKRFVNCYPLAIELVRSGDIDIKPLITHTYRLEEALEAFETTLNSGTNGAIKVQILCTQCRDTDQIV